MSTPLEIPDGWNWFNTRCRANAVLPHPRAGAVRAAGISLLLAAPNLEDALLRAGLLLQLLGWEMLSDTLQCSSVPEVLTREPIPDALDVCEGILQMHQLQRCRQAWENGFHLAVVANEDARKMLGPMADFPAPPEP